MKSALSYLILILSSSITYCSEPPQKELVREKEFPIGISDKITNKITPFLEELRQL